MKRALKILGVITLIGVVVTLIGFILGLLYSGSINSVIDDLDPDNMDEMEDVDIASEKW